MDNIEECKRFIEHLIAANPQLKDTFKKVDEISELSSIFKKQKCFIELNNQETQTDTINEENS